MPYQACPFCHAEKAQRVRFTPWGGVIGPALLTLVRCGDCGNHFNGKSGRSVKRAIKLYTLTTLLALIALMALLMYQVSGAKKSPARAGVATTTTLQGGAADLRV